MLGKRARENAEERSDYNDSDEEDEDKSHENTQQETAANQLKTRGIGNSRVRREKTIQQTAASNEAAQANAMA